MMEKEKISKDCAFIIGNGDFGIPVWRKYILSVQEASDYFHIGYKKLRKIIDENPNADFILWNGTRPQIKRKLFEKYIDECLSAI